MPHPKVFLRKGEVVNNVNKAKYIYFNENADKMHKTNFTIYFI